MGKESRSKVEDMSEERSTVKDWPLRHRLALTEYHGPSSTQISLHTYIVFLVLKESFDVHTVVFTLKIK